MSNMLITSPENLSILQLLTESGTPTPFAIEVRRLRLEARLSLRPFCKLIGMDASLWSRYERGCIVIPTYEVDVFVAICMHIGTGIIDYDEMKRLRILWNNDVAERTL